MRILGGTYKGRKLFTPQGVPTRPALARVRNSLFNILNNRLGNKHILDLFAGTGSLGFEALSQGAKFCLFIENNRKCCQSINENIEMLKLTDRASTALRNVFQIASYLIDKSLCFDVIFVTPPYEFFKDRRLKNKLINCLGELVSYSLLKPTGLIIIEYRQYQIQASEFKLLTQVDHRSYGQTELSFLQPKGE